MALFKRMKYATTYCRWARAKAAFGLLTSDIRHQWILTVGTAKPSEVQLDRVYPWYAFPSIGYIQQLIRPDMKVLEYGSGYSTIWWATKVAEVIALERSKEWCDEVRLALSRNKLTNVRLIYFEKLPDNLGEELTEANTSVRPLVDEYITMANVEPNSCDVVVVDDVFRNEVIEGVLAFIKPGGLLILDDSERERHRQVVELMNQLQWSFASFYGPGPFHFHEKQTTIWFKPATHNVTSKLP